MLIGQTVRMTIAATTRLGQWRPRGRTNALARPAQALPAPTKVVAILNPVSKHFRQVADELTAQSRQLGLPEPAIVTTSVESPGDAQARQALIAGADHVVVAGGDGTVRLVAGALAGSPATLGVVPVGSGNVFGTNLGMKPGHVARNVHTALTGPGSPVDIGWVRCLVGDEAHSGGGAAFLTMVGIGRDAETVLATRPALKRRLGPLAYAESGLRTSVRHALPMSVSYDGGAPVQVLVWTLLVANSPLVPGHVVVFPEARIDDGRLDTLEVPLRSWGQWLPVAAKGILNFAGDVSALHYGSACRVVVRPDQPCAVQVDGDAVSGVTELRVQVQPAAITVRVPGLAAG